MNETEKSFKEWALELSRQLEEKGLSLTGDSGQVDWTPDPDAQGHPADLRSVWISFEETWYQTSVKKEYIECPVCSGAGKVEEDWCYMCSGSGRIVVPPFADLGDQGDWAKRMREDQNCGLTDEDVLVLANYWSGKDRSETLGDFIRRVGARVLQNLQLSAGQAP